MAKKKTTNRRVIWIAGLTLFTALIWVALNSYHELARRDRIEGVEQLLTPINPELKEEVLEEIEERREYKIEEVEDFLKPKPTSTPVLEEESESEETAELEESEEAIEGEEASESTEAGEIND